MAVYTVKEYAMKYYPAVSERTVMRRLRDGLIPGHHRIKLHLCGNITIEVIEDIRIPKGQQFKQNIK